MTIHESVSHRDTLDIVFANRNRAYGAYQLRREYPAALSRAFGIGLLLIALMLLAPRILAALSNLVLDDPTTEVVATTTMIKIETPPPPVLNTAPAPPKPAIADPPPVVAPDDEVLVENPRDVQTLLEDPRDIGSKTVEGSGDAPPVLDPPNTGLRIVETPAPPDDETFEGFAVHKMPSFPGGETEMFKWIFKNLEYPEQARENGVSGPVVLQFVVGKDGSIGDVVVLKTPAGGKVLGIEAARVVQSMPRWIPGEANGHPVKVRFTLPLRFELK